MFDLLYVFESFYMSVTICLESRSIHKPPIVGKWEVKGPPLSTKEMHFLFLPTKFCIVIKDTCMKEVRYEKMRIKIPLSIFSRTRMD